MLDTVVEVHGSYMWPNIRFHRRVDELGYKFMLNDKWPNRELDVTDATHVWESSRSKYGFYETTDGLFYIATDSGEAQLTAVAKTEEALARVKQLAKQYAPEFEEEDENKIEVTFWSMSQNGPMSVSRSLDVPEWDDIDINYSTQVHKGLDAFFSPSWRPSLGGQLMLWHGPPGTGKTTALRALGREWREWCELHYITDPEEFFGRRADYMMNVMINGADDDKWRLLILEDCGEMIGADAKQQSGQGLSRLLNSVDGLIGQGLRFMILITTNEDLKKLHPAVTRPGRCLAQLEFGRLSTAEVMAWNKAHGVTSTSGSATIAELYAEKENFMNQTKKKVVGFAA